MTGVGGDRAWAPRLPGRPPQEPPALRATAHLPSWFPLLHLFRVTRGALAGQAAPGSLPLAGPRVLTRLSGLGRPPKQLLGRVRDPGVLPELRATPGYLPVSRRDSRRSPEERQAPRARHRGPVTSGIFKIAAALPGLRDGLAWVRAMSGALSFWAGAQQGRGGPKASVRGKGRWENSCGELRAVLALRSGRTVSVWKDRCACPFQPSAVWSRKLRGPDGEKNRVKKKKKT